VLDVAIAWALSVVFRPAGRRRSLLAAWFRLTYTAFLGVAVVFLFLALQLAIGSGYLEAYGTDQLSAGVMLALEAINVTWLIGLACFGVHLVLIGRMIIDTGIAPRLLGLLLSVAGSAYLVDTFAHALLSDDVA
jgi:hypothetical protein